MYVQYVIGMGLLAEINIVTSLDWFMVFNATFNNNSFISWRQFYWPQTLFEHWIAYKAIVGHTSETTVNCEAKPNCQYHLSSFVPN